MITGIILVLLICIGIYLCRKGWEYELGGGLLLIFSSIILIVHIIAICMVNYEYESFVVRRGAFKNTLNNARKNGNQYETAAIVKNIAKWNTLLAGYKYDNTTLLGDQYIDDRINNLKPIK